MSKYILAGLSIGIAIAFGIIAIAMGVFMIGAFVFDWAYSAVAALLIIGGAAIFFTWDFCRMVEGKSNFIDGVIVERMLKKEKETSNG